MAASLKKNFLFNSILTASNFIFPLLVYPYVTRVLGVANIGVCEFTDSIINYFSLFSMMGISVIGTREIAKTKASGGDMDRTFSSLFALNFITTLCALAILAICSVMVDRLAEHPDLMFYGAIKLFFNFLLINWFFQGLEDFKYVAIRTIIVKILYLVSVFVFVRHREDYGIYYLLTSLMMVLNAIVNLCYSRRFVKFILGKVDLKCFARQYFALGLYLFLCSMYTTFNVAYLGFACSDTEVGYYTCATKLHSIALAFFSAFTTVVMPRMSALISENRYDEYRVMLGKSSDVLANICIPVVIFSLCFAPEIVHIIAGNGFEGAVIPMMIVMPLALVIGYEQILVVQGLIPMREDKAVLINSAIGCVVGVTLNLILVKHLGASGSAVVWAVSELCVMASAQYFLTRRTGFHFPLKTLISRIAIYLPLSVLFFLSRNFIHGIWSALFVSAFAMMLYFFIVNFYVSRNDLIVSLFKRSK